ncbi:hypothetical protein UFOVP598_50 [uncultured Caudovirales phage]|uniref:Uncharacterized protein n=1 Tax=uncultured Caudovirales phage TaxID=2100421 RepID=A0A6J5MZR4_9CAUD|nr:hypothetical protein UFOVP598_50 [uncultured Caudovirales phage]
MIEREIKYENFVKRSSLMTNKHRKVYLARKNFKTLFCTLYNTRAKVVLKHGKMELFSYNITNYRKKYVNNECIN